MNPEKPVANSPKRDRIAGLFGVRIDPEHPLEARGARGPLLLLPALIQFSIGLILTLTAREGSSSRLIVYSLVLLNLTGAVGILSRRARLFGLGLVCAVLGFLLPVIIQVVGTPVDKDTLYVPGLGSYDAEGMGFLMFLRWIIEPPFWLLYAAIVAITWIRTRRETSIGHR